MSFTGVVDKAKHSWFEQLSFSSNATEKSCMAVGLGFDDRSVSPYNVIWLKQKNLDNVQIDALDLLVLLYYYLYYCIINCITVLLLVNTCQYLFVLLHLNSFWKIVINVVPASIVYIVNIVNIVITNCIDCTDWNYYCIYWKSEKV